MNTPRTIPTALLAVLLAATPAGLASFADGAANEPPLDFLTELLAVANVDGSLGIDLRMATPSVHGAAATVSEGRAMLDALSAAPTAADAFVAASGADAVPAPPVGTDLESEVDAFYARMGVAGGPALAAAIAGSAASVPADLAPALADVIAAVNAAIDAVDGGDLAARQQSAADLLSAVEDLAWLAGGSSTMSSSACSDLVFEDPLGFIIVNGTCDHTYDTHRVVQIDLGGNEAYNNNAGGASLNNVDDVLSPSVTPGEIPTAGLLDALLPIGDVPSLLTLPGVLTGFVTGCLDLCLVDPGLDLTNLRAAMPVALSVDLGSATDVYSSTENFVQGAGMTGIGILYDAGGSDSYTAGESSQGNGMALGLGILVDAGSGDDSFTAVSRSQGAGDGGYLLNLGSGEDVYLSGTGSQGAQALPFPAGTYPSVLFDAGGDDQYTATGVSQGAGNFLVDGSGNDHYTATGTTVSLTDGYAQGVSFGAEPGMLVDGDGDDVYDADIAFAQGYAAGTAVGALLDLAGDDVYATTQSGQGACHGGESLGLLADGSGDDSYLAGSGQGKALAPCIGALVDAFGNDGYTAGSKSQGSSLMAGGGSLGGAGLLVDAAGDDSYVATSGSQGSASAGLGLLLDADGTDAYTAGDASQGSASGTGVGVLVDGVQDAAGVTLDGDVDTAGGLSITGSLVVVSPGDAPPSGPVKADHYLAGAVSQGAASDGGVGVLLDNDDESEANGGPHRSTFTAGDGSQGAGSGNGVGALVNLQGSDDYVAGAGSQGSAVAGLAGVLVDASGRDSYTTSDDTVSRGYADSTADALSVALLLDTANNGDLYSSWPGTSHNNVCEEKGDGGLTVDVQLPAVPACDAALAAALTDLAGAAVAAASGVVLGVVATLVDTVTGVLDSVAPTTDPSTCAVTDYFCDDVDAGAHTWTQTAGLNEWRIVDQSLTPEPTGENAFSGNLYYYVGLQGYPGLGYHSSDGSGLLTTDDGSRFVLGGSFSIPATASAATFSAAVSGSSESGFDILHVHVIDTVTLVDTEVASISGLGDYSTPLTADLGAFIGGNPVQLVLRFSSDDILVDGFGWNVDDIRVY